VAGAHYPTPSIDDLMALAALGVDGSYITRMAAAGYRPATIHSLVEFKALAITPEWISGFSRVGYGNVPGDGLVQLRALASLRNISRASSALATAASRSASSCSCGRLALRRSSLGKRWERRLRCRPSASSSSTRYSASAVDPAEQSAPSPLCLRAESFGRTVGRLIDRRSRVLLGLD